MKNDISSYELLKLVDEFQIIQESRINNIFLAEDYSIIIELYSASIKRKYIVIKAPNYMFLTEKRPKTIDANEFIKTLRQKLINYIIKEIKQIDSDRLIQLITEYKKEQKIIYLEFFLKGNFVLIENNLISLIRDKKQFSERKIQIDSKYEILKGAYDFKKINLKDLNKLIKENITLATGKFIASKLSLGGDVSNYICEISSLNKDQFINEIGETEKQKIINSILNLVESKPITYFDQNLKVLPESNNPKKNQIFKTISEGIEFIHHNKQKEKLIKTSKYTSEINKLNKIIIKQENGLKENEELEIKYNEMGNEIYSKYENIDKIINEIKKSPNIIDDKKFLEKNYIISLNKKNKSLILKI